jgi:hypothetical protein
MKKTIVTLLMGAVCIGAANAQLIAGWDFQTTATGGTALGAQDGAQPTLFNANFGSGTLYLDGSEGSSSWVSSATASRELNAFTGTAVNASNGLSTVTTSPAALAFVNETANGKFAVFKFDLSTVFDPIEITLSAQRTSTGFTTQTWEFSTDGITYNPIGTLVSGTTTGTIASSFGGSGILTLPQFSGLAGASTAFVRATFDGATSGTGNNRVDNIQFNAVPEPSTYAMLALAGAGLAGYTIRRRRR